MNKLIVTVTVFASALSAATAARAMDGMKGADMGQTQSSGSASSAKTHHARGVVKKVEPKTGQVTLAHEPVKTLNWPAMTMDFQVRDKAVLDKLKAGQTIEFDFEQSGTGYVVTVVK